MAQETQSPIIHGVSPCGNIRTAGLRTAGKALRRADLSASVIARFHTKYDRLSPAACWLWRGAKTSSGYGSFGLVATRPVVSCSAHRVAYVLAHGDLPDGVLVMHSCDTPLCVNPSHLSAGTDAQNVMDARRKGRMTQRGRKAA